MSRVADALRKAGLQVDAAVDADVSALEVFKASEEPAPVEGPRSHGSAVVHRMTPPAPLVPVEPSKSDKPSAFRFVFERSDGALAACVRQGGLVVSPMFDVAGSQQYAKMASSLHHLQREHALKTFLVTSAMPGEGKTLTSANIALTLSESFNRKVLLVDADLRRPTINRVFNLERQPGLTAVLTEPAHDVRVVQVSRHLSVLPGGSGLADPVGAVTSDRMHDFIEAASAAFDWVIFDTPPLSLVPDATLLSGMLDGVLLVVRASSTQSDQLRRAISGIAPDRILGAVLNRAERVETTEYGYYAHSKTSSSTTPSR
jgi:protein-tyrosine kinase